MGSSDSGHSLSDGEGSTSASANSGGATTTPSVVSSASKRGQTGAMQLEKVDEENLATDGAATSSSQASSPSHAPSTPPTGNLATTNLNLQATSKEAAVEQSLDSSPENHPESFARSNPARARVIQPRYSHSLNFVNLFAPGKVAGRKNRTRNHFLNGQNSLTFDTYEFT